MNPCGQVLVQLRLATGLTSEEYVSTEYWRNASLSRCPFHPEGKCGFRRHGTYPRKVPPGTRIPRWYCPKAHATVSLLPDCFASKVSGSLKTVEQVVAEVERGDALLSVAVRHRPQTQPDSAMRWVRRRVRAVHACLCAVLGILPGLLAGCEPTLLSVRAALGAEWVLPVLREKSALHLAVLPPPLGFGQRPRPRRAWPNAVQQPLGRSPPAPGWYTSS